MAHFAASPNNQSESKPARATSDSASNISSSAGYYASAISQKTKLILPTAMWIFIGFALICALSLLASLNKTLKSLDAVIEHDQQLSTAAAQLMLLPEGSEESERIIANLAAKPSSTGEKSEPSTGKLDKIDASTDTEEDRELAKSFKHMTDSLNKLAQQSKFSYDKEESENGKSDESSNVISPSGSMPSFAPIRLVTEQEQLVPSSSVLTNKNTESKLESSLNGLLDRVFGQKLVGGNVKGHVISEQVICIDGNCKKTVKSSGDLPMHMPMPMPIPLPMSMPSKLPPPRFEIISDQDNDDEEEDNNNNRNKKLSAPMINANIEKMNVNINVDSKKDNDGHNDDENDDDSEISLEPVVNHRPPHGLMSMLFNNLPMPTPIHLAQHHEEVKHNRIDTPDHLFNIFNKMFEPKFGHSSEHTTIPGNQKHQSSMPPPMQGLAKVEPHKDVLDGIMQEKKTDGDDTVVMFIPLGMPKGSNPPPLSTMRPNHPPMMPPQHKDPAHFGSRPDTPPRVENGKPFDAPYELADESPMPPISMQRQPEIVFETDLMEPATPPLRSGPPLHPSHNSPTPGTEGRPQINHEPMFSILHSLFDGFGLFRPPTFVPFDSKNNKQIVPALTTTPPTTKEPIKETSNKEKERDDKEETIVFTSPSLIKEEDNQSSSMLKDKNNRNVGISDSFPSISKMSPFMPPNIHLFEDDDDNAFFSKHFGKQDKKDSKEEKKKLSRIEYEEDQKSEKSEATTPRSHESETQQPPATTTMPKESPLSMDNGRVEDNLSAVFADIQNKH